MIRPRHDWVVLQPIREEKVRESGLVIPDTIDERKPDIAKVIEVSDDIHSLNPDMRVIYKRYAGQTIFVDEEEYLMVKDEDIIGVVMPRDEAESSETA